MLTSTAARDARISLLALGAGSVVAQVVLLREILATFAGSEITAAVALGLWMVCTGLGSLLGARLDRPTPRLARGVSLPRRQLAATHLALALLPFAMLAAMRALPLVAGVRGSALSLPVALVGGLAVFLPYGLLSGGMVPVLGRLAAGDPPASISLGDGGGTRWAYALDSAGSAGGGLLLGFTLAAGLPHGFCLALAGSPHGLMAVLYGSAASGHRRSHPGDRFTVLGFAALIAVLFSVGPRIDRATLGWRYPGQEILLVRDTPFGQLAVTRTGTQRNLLQDAIPLTSTGDLSAETRVHPALCQVPEGAQVLLLGGSIAGSLRVAMLHRPRRVDCVETDAAIFRLGQGSAGATPAAFPEPALDSPGVRTYTGDGRAFVRRHRDAYDAILLHLPGPENAQLNRFYTEEFFREVHTALRPGGVVSFLLPSSPNYLGAEQIALERSITAALSRSFPEITILPGESHLYLASDRPVNLDLESILAARGIVTRRLLDYEWPELSDPFRRDELRELLLGAGSPRREDAPGLHPGRPAGPGRRLPDPVNRDLSPAAFRRFLDLRARLDAGGPRLVQAIVAASILAALLACVPGRRPRPDPAAPEVPSPGGDPPAMILSAVATSGFAAMALELAVLLLFQVIFGNLYLRLSLLVTLFLGGAAIGALVAPRLPGTARAQIRLADAAVALIALALLAVSKLGTGDVGARALDPGTQDAVRWIAGSVLLPALALLAAVPMGIQFAAAGRAAPGAMSPLGRLYLADLAGAASGTMVTGLWLLPRGGIPAVIAAVVAIKIASLGLQVRRAPARPAALEPWRTR
jgi:spermidine synthase